VRFGAHQEIGVIDAWEVAQDLRDAFGRQLACSPRARGVIGQSLLSAKEQHEDSTVAAPVNARPNWNAGQRR
jgi:hypothetical protein